MPKTVAFRPFAHTEITLGQAAEAFRLRCQAQGLSEGTLTWYNELLRPWRRFLEAKGVTLAKEVTPNLIRLHLESMRARGNCSGTIARTYGGPALLLRFSLPGVSGRVVRRPAGCKQGGILRRFFS